MCGIAGKLYLEPGRPVERESVEAMGRTLAHRGPDDQGLYVHGNVGLAMRRLAAIDGASGRRPSVDVESLSLYLSLLYIPAPHTIYREIRKLEAGHVMVWQGGRLTDRRYWNLAQTRPPARPRRPAVVSEELLALLTDAVRRQL